MAVLRIAQMRNDVTVPEEVVLDSVRFVRWAGPAGVVGGVAWVIGTAIHASRPVGCVGAGCAQSAMRESSTVEDALALTALLLFLVAAAGLMVLVRSANRFGTLGRIGTGLALVGTCLLIAAMGVNALLFHGDFTLMPYFVVPGIAAVVIGLLCLAINVLRAGVLPPWASVSLVMGALSLGVSNEQAATAWFAVPLGLAWIAVGIALGRATIPPATAGEARPVP